ncbi:MAG TPA: protein kinase [Candidatus Eisenbacteria bacterium]|nr:protein kinase [Candidatus Eisenbacteria bacterium]
MALSPKTRLGMYEILGPLGAGGMGEVYRAKDLRLGRSVAVKVLPPEVASSPDRLARFEREARTVALLNHPNIVTLFSIEDEGGIRFLTMELVEGRTLADLIPPGGLPLPQILDLGIPLADALVAAHGSGVIHRDLKPGNVMVTADGRVKVLDFGLAKVAWTDTSVVGDAVAETVDSPSSATGPLLGTIPYMAPEQIRGVAVDARADLFAMGILLHELATGRRPFTGATSADVMSSILRDRAEPLTHARPDLPVDLERVVDRCLEKNPRDRSTAVDVRNELRRIRRELEHPASEPRPPGGAASIAVLPFVNRSADPEDEYFSDGLADELLNVLAKIRGLRVAARTSAFHFKGKDTTIAEVGRALRVATVLEGSVRKAGTRIRIAVQLVQVSNGYHLWSGTYDRTLDDIFAVQDDIAQAVVKELRTTLLGEAPDSGASGRAKADVALAARGRGANPEAHRLYLHGRHFMDRTTRADTAKAIDYLKQAVALEPDFALAWAELSAAQSREADLSWCPIEEGYRRAREAAERSLALEPDLPEGHAALGWIQMSDLNWGRARASIHRALELAPGSARVLRVAGVLAKAEGRLEEAIRLERQAFEQNPLSGGAYHNLGNTLLAGDRFVEAEAAFRNSLELAPARAATRASLAFALAAQGRLDEAVAETMREPLEWARLRGLAILYHAMGRRVQSDEALRELIEKHGTESACQIAEVHGARGEADAAFDWLERAFAQRDPGLADVKPSPHLRSLHGDPRWDVFLEKLGLKD